MIFFNTYTTVLGKKEKCLDKNKQCKYRYDSVSEIMVQSKQ